MNTIKHRKTQPQIEPKAADEQTVIIFSGIDDGSALIEPEIIISAEEVNEGE